MVKCSQFIIKNNGKEVAWFKKTNGEYVLQQPQAIANAATFQEWHERLGHISPSTYKQLPPFLALPPLPTTFSCSTCDLNKSQKTPRPSITYKPSKPLSLIHSDLSGKFSIPSIGKAYYYITFIDDHSQFAWIYFLKKKSDAAKAIKDFTKMIERQTGHKIRRFRTDNGTEFINQALKDFFEEEGIIHETTAPYSPQSNGVAERFNQTITTMARCILKDLPKSLWAEAIAWSVYTKNRLPHSTISFKSPYELFYGQHPSLDHLKSFGTPCIIYIMPEERPPGSKLLPRGREGIICGYTHSNKLYRVYLKDTQQVKVTRDVTFPSTSAGRDSAEPPQVLEETSLELPEEPLPTAHKEQLPSAPLTTPPGALSHENELHEEPPNPEPQLQVRKSQRTPKPPGEWWKIRTEETSSSSTPRYSLRDRKPAAQHPEWTAHLATVQEPSSYTEAMKSPEKEHWVKAMQEELDSLKQNEVWEIVPTPTDRKLVGCRWVFKIKTDAQGNLTRYKARLVAKGYSQVKGIDYDELFAPVTRYQTLRFLLALGTSRRWTHRQLDVKTAFLNGILHQLIFMEVPEGLTLPEGLCCLLRKALYGLKQSPRQWHACLTDFLESQGFQRTNFDPCLFKRPEPFCLINFYVDDLFVFAEEDNCLQDITQQLSKQFEITDAGPITFGLGIQFTWTDEGLYLSQETYLKSVLARYGFSECRTVGTPLDPNTTLHKGTPEESLDDISKYQSIVRSLMYAALGTRPDLTYPVMVLSQYSSCPTETHLTAAKRVLRYIAHTLHWKLFYPCKASPSLVGYCDSSYASCPDDRRSFMGNTFLLNGCTITWASQKQKSVAVSTTEAEYMALSVSTRQAIWLSNGLAELGFPMIPHIFCDNQGGITLSKDPRMHKRSKHIDVHYHFVREKVDEEKVNISYIPSEKNVADMFTKSLGKNKFISFCSQLQCTE